MSCRGCLHVGFTRHLHLCYLVDDTHQHAFEPVCCWPEHRTDHWHSILIPDQYRLELVGCVAFLTCFHSQHVHNFLPVDDTVLVHVQLIHQVLQISSEHLFAGLLFQTLHIQTTHVHTADVEVLYARDILDDTLVHLCNGLDAFLALIVWHFLLDTKARTVELLGNCLQCFRCRLYPFTIG